MVNGRGHPRDEADQPGVWVDSQVRVGWSLYCENCGYNLLFIVIDLGIMERDRMSLSQPWVTDADGAVKYSLDVDIPGIWLSGEPFDMLKSRME